MSDVERNHRSSPREHRVVHGAHQSNARRWNAQTHRNGDSNCADLEFRTLDHQDQFSCRASNRYYSVALDVGTSFLSRALTPESRDHILATALSEVRFELTAGSDKGTKRHKTSQFGDRWLLGRGSSWMRRVMLAKPVAGDDRFCSRCRSPERDQLTRSWNHEHGASVGRRGISARVCLTRGLTGGRRSPCHVALHCWR